MNTGGGFARMPGRGGLTYAEPGITWEGRCPPDFHALRVTTVLGRGPAVFDAAADALASWRMHRRAGFTVAAEAGRAAPGVRVTLGLGAGPLRLTIPCRVVWTVREERRAGWAYGSLPGHPECGEEAFLVTLAPDGTVRLTVTAFSRPALWWVRAAGPLSHWAQRLAAAHYGRSLRRAVRRPAAGKAPGGRPGRR